MSDDEGLGRLAEPEDWPHGLRCIECSRNLIGSRYMDRLQSMFEDGTAVCEIVCVDCVLGARA